MRKISTKVKVVAISVALVCVAGTGLVYSLTQNSDNKKEAQGSTTATTISGDTTSGGNATKSQNQSSSGGSNPQDGVKLEIIDTHQQENGDLVIQTSISGTSTGTCKLVLSKGSSTVSKTASVLYQPSFSTCTGFTIPINELASGGAWKIVLTLELDGKTLATTEKEFMVQK